MPLLQAAKKKVSEATRQSEAVLMKAARGFSILERGGYAVARSKSCPRASRVNPARTSRAPDPHPFSRALHALLAEFANVDGAGAPSTEREAAG